jgi:hypothetical protein
MGALCGKESSNDPFSQPGRTLSSAPPPQTTSSVPAQRKVGGPPRALGGNSNTKASSEDDARWKAADAAIVSRPPLFNRRDLVTLFGVIETGSGVEESHWTIGSKESNRKIENPEETFGGECPAEYPRTRD